MISLPKYVPPQRFVSFGNFSQVKQQGSLQISQNFHVLSKITAEPPALPPLEHASAHILNTPLFERKYARVYLGNPESREAVDLRRQIAKGGREALEAQYWDVLERTIQARPMEARLGGDPSIANRVRAFVLVRHYRNGEWEDRIEVSTPTLSCGHRLSPHFGTIACGWTTALGEIVLHGEDGPCPRGLG